VPPLAFAGSLWLPQLKRGTLSRSKLESTMAAETIFSAVIPNLDVRSISQSIEPAGGTVAVLADGDVRIGIVLPELRLDLNTTSIPGKCQITGHTLDGYDLNVDEAYTATSSSSWREDSPPVTELQFSPMEMRLTNPAAGNANWTKKEFWLKGPRGLGTTRWSWDIYNFELHSIPVTNEDRSLASARLIVTRQLARGDFEDVKRATLALLSLACRTTCHWFMERTYFEDVVAEVRAIPHTGGHRSTHPLVPDAELSAFMPASTQAYLDSNNTYSLETLIGYYCRSHEDSLAEAKFVFGGVFMEAFKFYWALNVSGLPQCKKANGLVRGFSRPNGSWYGFEDLLSMASRHLGLNHTYTFIEDRNALFHTGKAVVAQTAPGSPTWPPLRTELTKLHDQIDDIFLTVLKYAGPIRSYWDQATTVRFPRPTPT